MNTTPTSDKKLTPMAAHRTFYEVLKKHQQENKCFLTSNEIHTILNAMDEYALQQAQASTPPVSAEVCDCCGSTESHLQCVCHNCRNKWTPQAPPVSANDMTAEEFFNHPDGMFTLNFLSEEEKKTLYKAIDLFVLGKLRQAKLSAPVSAREDVFPEIRQERIKQDAKWGEQNHAPADWLMILGEEVGEVNKAALEAKFGGKTLTEYREELVQVAAVTVAMIECFDRNHLPPPPSK